VTVTGPSGSNTATQTNSITVAPALLEVGDLTIDDVWKRVTFRQTFGDPIVVAAPLSANDFTPATVRIRHVGPTGFEIRIQEADYLNGRHAPETVSYLAMERGQHVLGTGIRVEAGRLTTPETPTQPFATVTFGQAFGVAPVVVSAVTSVNDARAMTTRMRNITTSSFEVAMQQLSNSAPNQATAATETIDYIAWEPSAGTVDGLTFEVNTTPEPVTDNLSTLRLLEPFLATPMFLAAMQTANNGAPTILRLDDKDPVEVHMQLEAEAALNDEFYPPAEVLGSMAFTYQ
jgi:PKD repeat protein